MGAPATACEGAGDGTHDEPSRRVSSRSSISLALAALTSCATSTAPPDASPSSADASSSPEPDAAALDARPAPDAESASDASAAREVLSHERVTMFALNTQEFVHLAEGRATLRAVIVLHEDAGVPLDVYLTDTVIALLEDEHERGGPDADLLDRVLGSPIVTLGYHTRAPKPYRTGFDWRGDLDEMATNDPASLRALVIDYEHHVTDPALGTPTARAGGYAHLAELAGSPPLVVGASADGPVQGPVWDAFAEMGASFFVSHASGGVSFGDLAGSLWLRPEHVDLRLIEVFEPAHAAGGCPQPWDADWAERPEALLDDALARACDGADVRPPCVVGVKMHDNDFFACDSAWSTIYAARGVLAAGPPFPLDREAALLDAAERARRWAFYERLVRHAASLTDTPAVSIADFAAAR